MITEPQITSHKDSSDSEIEIIMQPVPFCKMSTNVGTTVIHTAYNCYAASPWVFAWPPFLFSYPVCIPLSCSSHGLPYASISFESLDHHVIPWPHPYLMYYYQPLSFSNHLFTHPASLFPHVLLLISYLLDYSPGYSSFYASSFPCVLLTNMDNSI